MFERGGGVEEGKHPYDKTCRQCNGIEAFLSTGILINVVFMPCLQCTCRWGGGGINFVNNQTLGTLLLPFKIRFCKFGLKWRGWGWIFSFNLFS